MNPPAFPNDRHADAPLAEFIHLLGVLPIDGCDGAGALRYPFFYDCIASHQYLKYGSQRPWQTLLTAAVIDYRLPPAAVAFVPESSRHLALFQPVAHWLAERAIASAMLEKRRYQSLLEKAAFALPRVLRRIEPMLTSRRFQAQATECAETIRRHFQFEAAFTRWFSYFASLSYIRQRIARSVLEQAQPRVVVLCSEYIPSQRQVLLATQQLGIPTITLQHGFLGAEWAHFPSSANRICVWGEVDRAWFLERGTSANRVLVTGSPRVPAIPPEMRVQMRETYRIAPDERAVVFFAPNLPDAYHQRAAELLAQARNAVPTSRWFVRMHPSQQQARLDSYTAFESLPTSAPFEQALAISDLALHDYSTMAEAQYAGAKVGCLQLDAPYPDYYRTLLGEQVMISTPDDLVNALESIPPGSDFVITPGSTLLAGQEGAVPRIGDLIVEMLGQHQ